MIFILFLLFCAPIYGMERDNQDLASCDNLSCYEELDDNLESMFDNIPLDDLEKGIIQFLYAFTIRGETNDANFENSPTDQGDSR